MKSRYVIIWEDDLSKLHELTYKNYKVTNIQRGHGKRNPR